MGFKFKNKTYLLIFGIALLSSCNFFAKEKDKKDFPELNNPLFVSIFGNFENRLFRGINFGDQPKEIKAKEGKSLILVDEEPFILQYEFDFPIDSLKKFEYCNVNYLFDDSKLDIVSVEYFLKDSLKIENTYKSIVSALNFRYGGSSEDDFGYMVWEGYGNGSITSNEDKEEKYEIGIKRNYKIDEPNYVIEFSKIKEEK
jgi:hypothetical protein